MYLEALDILTADVDDEVYFGQEVLCGEKVGHSLDDAAVDRERVLDYLLAVAGDGRRDYVYIRIFVVKVAQKLEHNRHGVAAVRAVERFQYNAVGVDDDELYRSRAGVDAEAGVALIAVGVGVIDAVGGVARGELVVFSLRFEQRRAGEVFALGAVICDELYRFGQGRVLRGDVRAERRSERDEV